MIDGVDIHVTQLSIERGHLFPIHIRSEDQNISTSVHFPNLERLRHKFAIYDVRRGSSRLLYKYNFQ